MNDFNCKGSYRKGGFKPDFFDFKVDADKVIASVYDGDVTTYAYHIYPSELSAFKDWLDYTFVDADGEPQYTLSTSEGLVGMDCQEFLEVYDVEDMLGKKETPDVDSLASYLTALAEQQGYTLIGDMKDAIENELNSAE